jgi:hypothetical protein
LLKFTPASPCIAKKKKKKKRKKEITIEGTMKDEGESLRNRACSGGLEPALP